MVKFFFLFLIGFSAMAKETHREIKTIQKEKMALLNKQKKLIEEVNSLETMLRDLSLASEKRKKRISLHEAEIASQFPLLVRLARSNPLRLLVDPATSQNAVRGIILIRALTTSIKHQISRAQLELNEITSLSKDVSTKTQNHLNLLQSIESQQQKLKTLETQKTKNWQKEEEDRLADEEDINVLLDESRATLSEEEEKAQAATSLKGMPFRRLEKPVLGTIIKDSTLEKKFNSKNQGLIFETQKNADVFSPSQGTVVFKGPFRSQGDILIIDHGKHVHSVFIGMHKINAEVGQNVYAGEKIGIMAGYGTTNPKLYLELRQNGKPIDPRPFFTN